MESKYFFRTKENCNSKFLNYEKDKLWGCEKILSDSGKAGRLIASSDGNWIIEYLPERQKEYEIKKNLINELALKKQKEEHLKKEKF